ncbi:MAG: sensor histidine kinase, partial [Candidatus Adiutrix sp.]
PEITPRIGDFSDFLQKSLSLFQQAHKQVTFNLTIKCRPQPFAFDPKQMRRVLTNILDNSIMALGGVGKVEINLETTESETLRLIIADTGPGIDPKVRDRLFEPYITTKEDGQGLGLAIVRTIISAHHGSIKAIARPGGGAAFVIELPTGG